MQSTDRFSLDGWRAAGFIGFSPLLTTDYSKIPPRPGVYAVIRRSTETPVFEAVSSGGRFKSKDPSVPLTELVANWVNGTQTLYIGKAGTSLGRRLRDYQAFGIGRPVGHWGGRLIWQLSDRRDLLICWSTITDGDPALEETHLINLFRAQHGERPFANLRD